MKKGMISSLLFLLLVVVGCSDSSSSDADGTKVIFLARFNRFITGRD